MSHEIRTPLNAILGLAQIGQRDCVGLQTRHQFIRIVESGQHLLGIVNDVLDSAKIGGGGGGGGGGGAGKLSVEQIAIAPSQVIDSAITLSAERAFARGLDFRVRERGLPARCQGDPLRLSQVIVNLLGQRNQVHRARQRHPRGPRRPRHPLPERQRHRHRHEPRADRAPLQALRAGR